jgi:tRNA pseudouridine32 synthase/23S rRNA pseudouridine746 synthase
VLHRATGDYSAPLQLLAKQVFFTDPLSGIERSFSSNLLLQA